jgi:uncharacterized protein YeaO (DUF488 family)
MGDAGDDGSRIFMSRPPPAHAFAVRKTRVSSWNVRVRVEREMRAAVHHDQPASGSALCAE